MGCFGVVLGPALRGLEKKITLTFQKGVILAALEQRTELTGGKD